MGNVANYEKEKSCVFKKYNNDMIQKLNCSGIHIHLLCPIMNLDKQVAWILKQYERLQKLFAKGNGELKYNIDAAFNFLKSILFII